MRGRQQPPAQPRSKADPRKSPPDDATLKEQLRKLGPRKQPKRMPRGT